MMNTFTGLLKEMVPSMELSVEDDSRLPYISSSSPWTKAPQAPESIRFTAVVSTFSLGASSAHFLPEENSPELYSSLALS
ncbi:hypothetical protein JZ751_025370 [Albula glossodonta]|uniref:Uncharacterized protein n=1 Tax=Albula glossodonta TaxID=121402 RepID=A0A8T2NM46_9TELE|nr:hypothetical protein JZ751_025370 [Albula glossodonta]